jgi:uncharacterized oligopeptide transporter (OPT) family protein
MIMGCSGRLGEGSELVKKAAQLLIKIIGGIAAVVFIRSNPFGSNQGVAFLISIPVLVLCAGLLIWLKDDQSIEENQTEKQQSTNYNP